MSTEYVDLTSFQLFFLVIVEMKPRKMKYAL